MNEIRETKWVEAPDGTRFKRYFFTDNNGKLAFSLSVLSMYELEMIRDKDLSVIKDFPRAKRKNALRTVELAIEDNSLIQTIEWSE